MIRQEFRRVPKTEEESQGAPLVQPLTSGPAIHAFVIHSAEWAPNLCLDSSRHLGLSRGAKWHRSKVGGRGVPRAGERHCYIGSCACPGTGTPGSANSRCRGLEAATCPVHPEDKQGVGLGWREQWRGLRSEEKERPYGAVRHLDFTLSWRETVICLTSLESHLGCSEAMGTQGGSQGQLWHLEPCWKPAEQSASRDEGAQTMLGKGPWASKKT